MFGGFLSTKICKYSQTKVSQNVTHPVKSKGHTVHSTCTKTLPHVIYVAHVLAYIAAVAMRVMICFSVFCLLNYSVSKFILQQMLHLNTCHQLTTVFTLLAIDKGPWVKMP